MKPELARLEEVAADHRDEIRPLVDGQQRPFSRRRYVLLCLALALLSRSESQSTMGALADDVLLQPSDPELVAAGGDEESYLRTASDVLYDVDKRVLARLLAGPQGPSTIAATSREERLQALTATSQPGSLDGRNRAIRHRLTRRFRDDPWTRTRTPANSLT